MTDKTIDLTEENIAEHANDIIAKMLEGFVPYLSKISPRIITLRQHKNHGMYDNWIYSNNYRFKGKLKKQLEAALKIETVLDDGEKSWRSSITDKEWEYDLYFFFKRFTYTRKEKIANLLAE